MMGDNVYWGGDFKKTLAFINQHPVDSSKIKFFIGYSGWSQGQLENELKEKSWLIAPPNLQIIFSGLEEKIWKAGIDLLDDNFKQLKNYPIDPQLN
jgi:putative transcriptional regulator